MDFLQEFNRLMESTLNIALATSVDNIPNVRLINFCYDEGNKGVIYFTTFKGSSKITEFSQNNRVSFTTVPIGHHEHVKVINGIVKKSDINPSQLIDMYTKKYPDMGTSLIQGDMIGVYEVRFDEAEVTLGLNQRGKVTL